MLLSCYFDGMFTEIPRPCDIRRHLHNRMTICLRSYLVGFITLTDRQLRNCCTWIAAIDLFQRVVVDFGPKRHAKLRVRERWAFWVLIFALMRNTPEPTKWTSKWFLAISFVGSSPSFRRSLSIRFQWRHRCLSQNEAHRVTHEGEGVR